MKTIVLMRMTCQGRRRFCRRMRMGHLKWRGRPRKRRSKKAGSKLVLEGKVGFSSRT